MNFLDIISGAGRFFSAAAFPSVPLPKAPKSGQSLPGYRTQIEDRQSAIARNDRQLATTDRLTARTLQDTRKTLLELSRSSPDIANAVNSMLRTGIPEGFAMVAYNAEGFIDRDATMAALTLYKRMCYLNNPDGSAYNTLSLQSLSEELAIELMLYGALSFEVVLDKTRMPSRFSPISVTTVELYDEGQGFKLKQKVGGELIDLDYPTVIYVAVDQVQTEAYAQPYMESAIQPVLADIDYNNDLRRALKRNIFPRVTAVIDSEKIRKMTPPEILADAAKFKAYKEAIISTIQDTIQNSNPEDAYITFDSVKYAFIDKESDPSRLVESVQKVLNGKLASGAKSLPVVLGHGVQSNASSTEAMLYVKNANMLRQKLNEAYSRAFTIAVRLLGYDVYVKFEYETIDLRPTSELEAFKAMKQSRVLELLDYGFYTDDEASIILTGNLTPAGYVPKSGAMQRAKGVKVAENPTSNTSAMEQTLKPGTPQEPKS